MTIKTVAVGLALFCAGSMAWAGRIADISGGNPATAYAATELKRVLEHATGEEYHVGAAASAGEAPVIYVGGDEQNYSEGEFHYYSEGKDLHLTGGGDKGALYAVNHFLDEVIGNRVYTVRLEDEVIPVCKPLDYSGLDRRGRAAFPVRHFTNYYFPDTAGVKQFFARNNFNVSVRLPEGVDCDYPFVGPGVHSLGFYIPAGETPALDYYKPWPSHRNLFATHPEYFSMDKNGKRVTSMQLCFSNPGLRQMLTEHLCEQLEAAGGRGAVEVSANDVPGAFCCCKDCLALAEKYRTPSGPLIDYLLEACPKIAARFPAAVVKTLAYRKEQSEVPPAGVEHLPDNLIVIFAPIDSDFGKSLDAPSNSDTLDHLRQWCRMSKNVWVWYYVNCYGDGGELPVGNFDRLIRDAKLMHDSGASGVFYEHDVNVTSGLNMTELQSWLLGRLGENPDAATDALITEFTDFYYGDAASQVRNYFAELETCLKEMPSPLSWCPRSDSFYYLTPARLVRWQKGFDDLEAATAGVYLERVKTLRITLDIATLYRYRSILKAGLEPGIAPAALSARIVERWAQAQQRTQPGVAPVDKEKLAERFANAVLLAETDPKPLPPPLDKIPPERVTQLFPSQNPTVDPDAALGRCLSSDQKESPLTMGVYDGTARQWILSRAIPPEELKKDGQWHFYRVGSSRVTPDSCFWLTQSWFATIPLSGQYRMGDPNREWELWVSLKLTDEPRIAIDRLILVAPAN